MNELSTVFYPYVGLRQIDAVKVAAVYFDRVYVLNPISVLETTTVSNYYQELPHRLMSRYGDDLGLVYVDDGGIELELVSATLDFHQQVKPLVDAGVVQVINPFDELKRAGLNSEFESIVGYRSRQATRLAASYERPSYDNFVSAVAWSPPRGRIDRRGLLLARTDAVRSIMFDSAILVSKRLGAIPLASDARTDHDFSTLVTTGECTLEELQMRYPWLDAVEDEIARHRHNREMESFEIARQSILENVPLFQHAAAKDILRVRRHCADELSEFRNHMRRLAASISTGPFDVEKRKEIMDSVAKEVTPVMGELERRLRLTRRQWAERLLDQAASVETVATLATTVFVGLPLYYGLLVAAGLAGAQAGLKTYFAQEELVKGNGLSLLLKLQKMAR